VVSPLRIFQLNVVRISRPFHERCMSHLFNLLDLYRNFKRGNECSIEGGGHRSLCSNRRRPLYREKSHANANSRYRALQNGDRHRSLCSNAAYGRLSRSSGHPVVLYSSICEKWVLNSTNDGRIERGDMKSLRGDASHNLRDEISNGTIRNELQIFNIVGNIADL